MLIWSMSLTSSTGPLTHDLSGIGADGSLIPAPLWRRAPLHGLEQSLPNAPPVGGLTPQPSPIRLARAQVHGIAWQTWILQELF